MKKLRYDTHKKPGKPFPREREDSGVEIAIYRRNWPFSRSLQWFFLDDIEDIVESQDADETVFPVHNRDGLQVVFRHGCRGFFLVSVSGDEDGKVIHEIGDSSFRRCEDEVLQVNRSEFSLGAYHERCINGLLFCSRCADPVKGLRCSHALLEVDESGVMDSAGGIGGIV